MANSITILPITSYLESRPQPVTGDNFKGDTFYGHSGSVRTVQWKIYEFVGTIGLQASLSLNPTESDWFLIKLGNPGEMSLDTTGKLATASASTVSYSTATSGVFGFNFTGNFLWIRAYINNWSAGNVDSIIISK
jgi:hypothetical protein